MTLDDRPVPEDRSPVLEVDRISVTYPGRRTVPWRKQQPVLAVREASLYVLPGETLGLVGESGSGKSTIGRAILRLTDVAEGTIRTTDADVTGFGRTVPTSYRRSVQMVWQDPYSSLNPTMTIGQMLGETLSLHRGVRGASARAAAADLLTRVGLDAAHLDRHPHEFSGGQRQRIAIARAIAPQPDLIVLDEAVSALDVSTQSQIIGLLEQLQRDSGVAYLFIGHDLSVVRHICHRIAVMYAGRIVESGPTDQVCDHPMHPYTEALLAASPVPDPIVQRQRGAERRALIGHADAAPLSTGCPFAPRCPHAMPVCWTTMPATVASSNHTTVACHLYLDDGSPSDRTTPVA